MRNFCYPYTQNFNTSAAGWRATGQTPPANNGRNFVRGSLPYLNGAQGNGDSWYVHTTTSGNGTHIWVESPIFNFAGLANPQLFLDIKHALHPSDYFHVEYSTNNGTTWTQLGTSADPLWYNTTNWWSSSYTAPVNSWARVQHSLCALAGQTCVKLRVYGRPYYSEPTYTGYHYFAFDNVTVADGPNVAVTAYIDPVDVGCLFATNQPVTVRVFNGSCGAISNVPIQCDVTGALTATLSGTVLGPIAAGATTDYTFPGTINMTAVGVYNFNTFTQLPTDINRANDTLATSINVTNLKVTTYPYSEDFNSGAAYWSASGDAPPANNGRNFVLGAVPYLGGAQGNGDSWYVETTTSGNGTYIWVESPVFDFSNLTNPLLSFDIKHSLHPSDYFHVEYSINGGTSWAQLGTSADPMWYNTTNWWSSSYTAPLNNWITVEHGLCNLIGQPCVKFRVYGRPYYIAPTYTGYHYFAFDNFHITNTPIDADANFAISCFGGVYELEVTVLNENRLCVVSPNITSIDINYIIDGGAVNTQTITGLNIPYGSAGTAVVQGFSVPTNNSIVKIWTSNPNGLNDHIFENDTVYVYSSNWPDCNDHCSHATVLGLGTTTASQTDNATIDVAEDPTYSNCGFLTIENTVWYQFTTNSSGDSVEVFFENQDCSPSQNGIQISIDQATTACDMATYTNMYCSATGDTAWVSWGPLQLPPNTTYYIAVDGFAGSDCDFTIRLRGAIDPLLPLQLASFDARCVANGTELSWQTAQEQNNDYFDIERSTDGITFEAIKRIESLGAASNANSYYFKDLQAPPTGTIYYRLRQVDVFQNGTFSKIKAVICHSEKADVLSIYPNPTTGEFTLSGTAQADAALDIEIYDALGKLVYEQHKTLSNVYLLETIDLSHFPAAAYSVHISIDGNTSTKKLIIARP